MTNLASDWTRDWVWRRWVPCKGDGCKDLTEERYTSYAGAEGSSLCTKCGYRRKLPASGNPELKERDDE